MPAEYQRQFMFTLQILKIRKSVSNLVVDAGVVFAGVSIISINTNSGRPTRNTTI
jgi:hypothetical protein